VHEASVIADALVAAYNPQLATWTHSPAANEIERFVLEFLLCRLGFDPAASAASFTSGGMEANLSAIPVALTRAYPAYREEGLRACWPPPVIYLSAEGHHSFAKAAQVTGLGRGALRLVAVREDLRLDVDELERRIAEDRERGLRPLLAVGTAGTTGAGVVDPLAPLAALCRREGLWLHVDAAWGGAALLAPRLKPHLEGIEEADSVTWDAHKWLSVPMGAGMFFCRHPEAVAGAFGTPASYMPGTAAGTFDPYLTSLQWSRRFTGLKLFMALAELGASGMAALVEHQARMGEELRELLAGRGWTLVNTTPLPVVCFTHPRVEQGTADLDRLLDRIYRQGKTWVSAVTLPHGRRALRACITSFRTESEDLQMLVEALEEALAG